MAVIWLDKPLTKELSNSPTSNFNSEIPALLSEFMKNTMHACVCECV